VLAGKIIYWQGWVFCGICLLSIIIVSMRFADRKDLLTERLKPKRPERKTNNSLKER